MESILLIEYDSACRVLSDTLNREKEIDANTSTKTVVAKLDSIMDSVVEEFTSYKSALAA